MASGNLPDVLSVEVCARTLGLLGAEGSATISHFGAPPSCVIATDQSGGMAPAFAESKFSFCAEAEQTMIRKKPTRTMQPPTDPVCRALTSAPWLELRPSPSPSNAETRTEALHASYDCESQQC